MEDRSWVKGLVPETLDAHRAAIDAVACLEPSILEVARRMERCLAAGGKICWMGNGGSAADSQHLAAELVGRFRGERPAMASIALTTDSSILTSAANDAGFETVFARQVRALCRPEDMAVGLSTSGRSANVLEGLRAARELGLFTVGLCGGAGGELAELADRALVVPSEDPARVQEAHMVIGHIWCEYLDAWRRSRSA
ncbi:MAG: SIS domain-containing protein [Gemmatimonadota bacterium]